MANPMDRGAPKAYTVLGKSFHDGRLYRGGEVIMLYDDEVGPHHAAIASAEPSKNSDRDEGDPRFLSFGTPSKSLPAKISRQRMTSIPADAFRAGLAPSVEPKKRGRPVKPRA